MLATLRMRNMPQQVRSTHELLHTFGAWLSETHVPLSWHFNTTVFIIFHFLLVCFFDRVPENSGQMTTVVGNLACFPFCFVLLFFHTSNNNKWTLFHALHFAAVCCLLLAFVVYFTEYTRLDLPTMVKFATCESNKYAICSFNQSCHVHCSIYDQKT